MALLLACAASSSSWVTGVKWMNKHCAASTWGKDRINRPQMALLSWAIVLNKPLYLLSHLYSSSSLHAPFFPLQWKLSCLIPLSHITTVTNNIKKPGTISSTMGWGLNCSLFCLWSLRFLFSRCLTHQEQIFWEVEEFPLKCPPI